MEDDVMSGTASAAMSRKTKMARENGVYQRNKLAVGRDFTGYEAGYTLAPQEGRASAGQVMRRRGTFVLSADRMLPGSCGWRNEVRGH